MIGSFFRENREAIRTALSILMMIGGLVLVILRHILLGILVLFGGVALLGLTLGGLLNSSGYAGEDALSRGIGGQGRGASAKNSNTKTVASETTSAIWDQMKGDNNKK